MNFWKFLFSLTFLKNLAIVLIAGVLLFWGTLMALKAFTHHGQEFDLPNFTGLYPDEVSNQERAEQLNFEIIDTIFSELHERGSIASQSPSPGSKVKEGRRVFLTVVSDEAEQVSMPNVTNITLRLATAKLEAFGLRIGQKEYVPSQFKDAVLVQKYKGAVIAPGTEILKGSVIDLEIGQGLGGERISVPLLLGLKQSQVMRILSQTSLNIGTEVFDDITDTSLVRVYRQTPNPTRSHVLHRGATIDLWYRQGTIEEFDALKGRYVPDTTRTEDEFSDDLLP